MKKEIDEFAEYIEDCWIKKINTYIKLIQSIERFGYAELGDDEIKYIFTRSTKKRGWWQKTCLINNKPISDDKDKDYFELIKRHC